LLVFRLQKDEWVAEFEHIPTGEHYFEFVEADSQEWAEYLACYTHEGLGESELVNIRPRRLAKIV
jgi:hypothetical protein